MGWCHLPTSRAPLITRLFLPEQGHVVSDESEGVDVFAPLAVSSALDSIFPLAGLAGFIGFGWLRRHLAGFTNRFRSVCRSPVHFTPSVPLLSPPPRSAEQGWPA